MITENKETIEKFPYVYIVSKEDEKFFQKEVESQKLFNELIGVTDMHIEVKMTLERYFELYEWKYKTIESQVNILLKQRNKTYAHNDKKSLDNIEKVISEFAINGNDIDSFISFALEFCKFIIVLLTGVNKADKPVNINDWEGTLNLVRLGYKYKDIEIAQSMKEIDERLFPETE